MDQNQHTCKNHPDAPAVAQCSVCGDWFCADCVATVGDKVYCKSHVQEAFSRDTATGEEPPEVSPLQPHRRAPALLFLRFDRSAPLLYRLRRARDRQRHLRHPLPDPALHPSRRHPRFYRDRFYQDRRRYRQGRKKPHHLQITQKAEVFTPRLFCVERKITSNAPCGGRRTVHRIYSISHLSRFVNTTICGIFYFADRHTAMAIW